MNATIPNVILQRFLDYLFPFFQIIHTPTRNEAILDIVLTNSLETVRDINDHPPIGTSDHSLITGHIVLKECSKNTQTLEITRNFRQTDFEKLGNI